MAVFFLLFKTKRKEKCFHNDCQLTSQTTTLGLLRGLKTDIGTEGSSSGQLI